MTHRSQKQRGFTLVELVVSMAVAGVMLSLVYALFTVQSRSSTAQTQTVTVHQNIRSYLYYLTYSIRMAGIDPLGTGNFGFFHADASVDASAVTDASGISFRFDDNEDGVLDGNESTSFRLSGSQLQQLFYDAVSDNYLWETLSENTEALNFVYLDASGNVIAAPSASLEEIRSIQMTVIARSEFPVKGHTDSETYTNKQGTVILSAQNDRFLRRSLTTTIRCRNMGLN